MKFFKIYCLVIDEKAGVTSCKNIKGESVPCLTTAASSPWTWTCDPASTFCKKERHVEGRPQQVEPYTPKSTKYRLNSNISQGEALCRLSCAPSTLLWPMPTSQTIKQGVTASFSPGLITTIIEAPTEEVYVNLYIFFNSNIFFFYC